MAGPENVIARAARVATGLQRRGESVRDSSQILAGQSLEFIPYSELLEQRLEEIKEAFAGVRLQERYEVAAETLGDSQVVRIRQPCSVKALRLPSAEHVRTMLSTRLDLVRGIGPYRTARLRADGVRTLADLLDPLLYPRFADDAALVLGEIESDDLVSICERLRSRFGGRGHLMAALLAGTVDIGEVGFLDVETLGLDNNMIFLVGVGRFGEDGFVVEQFLAPRPADEPAALSLAVAALDGVRVLITYNGRTADLPWLANRCFYHRLAPLPEIAHLDLLYGTRRRWRIDEERLPDARLPTVQELLLGLERPLHDVPSYLVPDLYDAYTRSPEDEGLLVPVIDHNRSDIEALCVLLEMLCVEAAAVDSVSSWVGADGTAVGERAPR